MPRVRRTATAEQRAQSPKVGRRKLSDLFQSMKPFYRVKRWDGAWGVFRCLVKTISGSLEETLLSSFEREVQADEEARRLTMLEKWR